MSESAEGNSDGGDLGKFNQVWATETEFPRVLAEVNNQPIGMRFMVVAFSFFLIGGMLALLMRIQLAVSENSFLGPRVYNQLFTMHGSTMMYLFIVPFLEGMAAYLLPLQLGARDLAFPRMTGFSFWVYVFGGVLFYISFLVGEVPEVGWFAYAPLSGPKYSGLGTDFWLLGLGMIEFAGIGAGAEITVSILKLRAPGMTINRLPLFVWAWLVVGLMILFAFTTLLMATLLLELDRDVGTHFFNAERGGTSLLWQHLFWFFGHPEVYIIFLPATGIVSMVVAAFSRRICGYTLIAVAVVVTGFISFGLWVHHMYTTGLPELSMMFFAAASLMIAIASGTQVFAWIASLWGRRPPLVTPLLFVLGFLFIFVLGGLTGIMVAIVPFDWQVHDTYFLVAHFHYVLIGGAVFPVMAGIHFWGPKFTGRMLNDRLGKWSFWLTFIGFNVTFFPMHIMGLLGMPRRVYTYSASLNLDGLNLLATIGSFALAIGFLLLVINVWHSVLYGRLAGNDPWGGDSLEWSVESPPPAAIFAEIPIVHSRHPMWETEPPPEPPAAVRRVQRALLAAPDDRRATLVTDAIYARPQAIQFLPSSSYDPLLLAIGMTALPVATLIESYLLTALSAIFSVGVLIHWLYPRDDAATHQRARELGERAGVTTFPTGTISMGWWGAICLLAAVATAFGTLLYSYFYLRLYSTAWPQDGIARPSVTLPAVAFGLLILGAAPQAFASAGFRRGAWRRLQVGLAATLALTIIFLGLQAYMLSQLDFTPQTNAYGSAFYTLHWFLALLVMTQGALLVAALARISRRGDFPREVFALQMEIAALFSYFTYVVALIGFATLYLSPHWI